MIAKLTEGHDDDATRDLRQLEVALADSGLTVEQVREWIESYLAAKGEDDGN